MAITVADLLVKFAAIGVDKVTGGMQQVEEEAQSFSQKMTGLGAKMTAGITAPLVGFGAVALNAASDLGESMSKVNVVFGANNSVVAWSENAASAMGMSQQQALETAGTFGNFFTAMGHSQADASRMSTTLVTLASDLASFNNMDPTEAAQKLMSAMAGESEAARSLGIDIGEAAMQAKALEMGLGDNVAALTEGQKQAVRYALIMEDTANAQGDFARTSGGLANQMRIARASFMDAAASLGVVLLPAAVAIVKVVVSIFKAITNLPGPIKTFAVVLGAVAAAAGPVLVAIGTLAASATAIAGAFGAGGALAALGPAILAVLGPIALIVGALVALGIAYKTNFLGIRDLVSYVGKLIRVFGPLFAVVKALLGFGDDSLGKTLIKLGTAMRLVGFSEKQIKGLREFLRSMTDLGAKVGDAIRSLLARFSEAQAQLVAWGVVVAGAMRSALGYLETAFGYLLEFVGVVIGGIIARLDPLISAFEGVGMMITGIISVFSNLFAGDFRGAFDSAIQIVEGWLQFMAGLGGFILSILSGALSAIWDAIAAVDWVGIGVALLGYLQQSISAMGSLAELLWAKAGELIGSLTTWFSTYNWAELGATLLGYLQQAISAMGVMTELLWAKAEELLAGLVSWFSTYNWAALGTTLLTHLQTAIGAMGSLAETLWAKGEELLGGLVTWFSTYDWATLGTTLLGYLVDAVGLYVDLYATLATKAVDMLQGLWDWLAAYDWATLGTTLLGYIVDAVGLYVDLYSTLATKAVDLLQGLWDWLAAYDWAGLGTTLLGYIVDAITLYVKLYDTLLTAASDLVSGLVDWIADYDWAGLATDIVGYITDAITLYVKLYTKLATAAADLVGGFVDSIRNYDWAGLGTSILGWIGDAITAMGSLANLLWNEGYNIVWGLAQGVYDNATEIVGNAIEWAAGLIPGWARKALGIDSPSKVMMPIGKNVAAGLAVGIRDGVGVVEKAVGELARSASDIDIAPPAMGALAEKLSGSLTQALKGENTGSGLTRLGSTSPGSGRVSGASRPLGTKAPVVYNSFAVMTRAELEAFFAASDMVKVLTDRSEFTAVYGGA